MREVKFRALNEKGVWVYGYYAYGCYYPDSYKTHRMFPSNEEVDPETVGQYTGLKDKNGKEIYEGDIVVPRYNRFKPMVVEYEDGKYNICEYNIKKCEVTCNVFEHKELITHDKTSI